MGQVWYLIVSIPDLFTLTYFKMFGAIFPASMFEKKTGFNLDTIFILTIKIQGSTCFFSTVLLDKSVGKIKKYIKYKPPTHPNFS